MFETCVSLTILCYFRDTMESIAVDDINQKSAGFLELLRRNVEKGLNDYGLTLVSFDIQEIEAQAI